PTIVGNYWYRLTVAESGNGNIAACRIGSNVLTINVHPKPAISAGPDRFLIAGQQTTLAATAPGGTTVFNWSPPDYLSSTSILTPTASPTISLTYSLTIVSQFGCVNEDQVFVKVVAGIFVPTGFTPNNDGKNDSWRIPYLDPQMGATVNVYNRWGQLIYQAIGTEVNWDGKLKGIPQPSGTYVYQIHFTNGSPQMKGTVSIIR
ncbi:MAG: gliding motility-associated C-terminal domain-containing protein, partial [Chitinophagaceae bacterium]|nr:gliding motility-associated C-terminal domain-containing protein [Chitinophagaceae bacterium]